MAIFKEIAPEDVTPLRKLGVTVWFSSGKQPVESDGWYCVHPDMYPNLDVARASVRNSNWRWKVEVDEDG